MGKVGELMINKRSVYEIVKGNPIGSKGKVITSWDMFADMCERRRFINRLGHDVVDLVFDHHNITDVRRGHMARDFLAFLNGKQDEIVIPNANVPKRQRMDMSFDESVDVDLDVSMSSQPDYEKRIADLEHQLQLKDDTIKLLSDNH